MLEIGGVYKMSDASRVFDTSGLNQSPQQMYGSFLQVERMSI